MNCLEPKLQWKPVAFRNKAGNSHKPQFYEP